MGHPKKCEIEGTVCSNVAPIKSLYPTYQTPEVMPSGAGLSFRIILSEVRYGKLWGIVGKGDNLPQSINEAAVSNRLEPLVLSTNWGYLSQ